MRRAEQVTFGGSALDRAAHIRTDQDRLLALQSQPDACVLVLWRGKPAIADSESSELLRVGVNHPVVTEARREAVNLFLFLGVEDNGAPCFALDLVSWEPDDQDLSQMGLFLDPSEQRHPDLPDGHAFAELRRIMTRLSPRDAELAATAKALAGWHATHGFCACCGKPTDVTQAGWQRACPSCGAQHFPRTDPVVIMLITHGNSVLMGRSPGWPEGMYSLLAGFVEPGETLEAAVRREVLEEAGVPVGQVSYLSSQPWPFPSSLMFGCAGEALSTEIEIDPVEIEDALWVTREEMMRVFAGEHPLLKPAREGAIAHFLLQNWLADTLD